MKWPWVSRETYAATEQWARSADARCVNLTQLLRDAQGRYDALLDKYHALKVVGASAPEPVRTALVRPDNPVMDAIGLASGADMERRAFLGAWATDQRLRGREEADIVHELLNWRSVDDDDADMFS